MRVLFPTHFVRRVLAFALTLALLLSLTATALALGELPSANSQPRHTVCTHLSHAAEDYYTGEFSYENLKSLSGARDITDGRAAMEGNRLYSALHRLMADTHTFYVSYSGYKAGSLAYYWASTDAVSSSPTNVMFYSDIMANENGVKLNREHVWPKSRGSFAESNGGADLHHLRPSVEPVNMAKSDHAFGFINGTFADDYKVGVLSGKTVYYLKEDEGLFECKDDVKGDVARILLYVYCRWGQPNLFADITSNLPSPDPDDKTNTGVKVIESLDTLLLWCEMDPVDKWEMERNDLTQQVQGNRNVFIDYPELAWRMFGIEVPAGMATPTSKGCDHQFELFAEDEADCLEDGFRTVRCSVCGNQRTRRLAAVGHCDDNHDDLCDRCGQELAIFAHLPHVTSLTDGMHLLIIHRASSTTFDGTFNSADKANLCSVNIAKDTVNPPLDSAMFIVKMAENSSFYLIHDGKYLTSAPSGNKLYLIDEPDDYSLWRLEAGNEKRSVHIRCVNAYYNDKPQYLECYSNHFTTYSIQDGDGFEFDLYGIYEHFWDSGKPIPDQPGKVIITCQLCSETHITSIGGIKGDVDSGGHVDNVDLVLLARYLVQLEPALPNMDNADMDGDGAIDNKDLVSLAMKIVNS